MTWQKLEQLVKDMIRPLKGRKREQAAFAIAALCFSGGFALGGKLAPEFKADSKWIAWVQVALYALGAISFVYGVIRVWRLVHPPELPPAKDRPSAIKGPMAFTEADGELFRKLGRESELQKLLGMALDDQLVIVVVRGASGAGKTSLLRAGLKHILKNNPDGKDVQFHYWEAVPTKPDEGLLRALQEKWPEGVTKPVGLDELVNPADALGRQSHVIVLDQFEQLRGSRKIFSLLRRIVRESKPPHRITWVIAFRREFSADWLDFVSPEIERGIRPPQDVSLRLFTAEQAREVIGQLVNESNLKDSIEQSVINNLVEAATVESEVSPVDIGIGLLVLAELHERQSGDTITIRDYQFAGGAEGLLTQYISRCLDLFPKEHQEAILKAMLALRDPETNQRLAEGLPIDVLSKESGAEARLLKTQLDRLSHRDTRLLETVTPTDGSPMRYRLPHERLVPALYRLTGKLLAEVDQAKLKFQNAFQAWKTNGKRSHYLLKAKELRLVERFETQIPWGNDEQEKKSYLDRSKRRRNVIKGTVATVAIALIGISWAGYFQYKRIEGRRYLEERNYSPELYNWQHQLKILKMTEPLDLEHFTWLTSETIEELELRATESSNSLAGLRSLSRCHSLKKMVIDLESSQVRSLEPLSELNTLTHLTLKLGASHLSQNQVSNLEPLSKLSNLTALTLYLNSSQAAGLEPLSKLGNLTQLTLYINSSDVINLQPLSALSNLEQLTLSLYFSPSINWDPLSKLRHLTQLTVDLSKSAQWSDLTGLSKLNNLRQLVLDLRYNYVSKLDTLSMLSNLAQLKIDLRGNNGFSWEELSKLNNLTQVTLDSNSAQDKGLEELSKMSNPAQLAVDYRDREVQDWDRLSKLKNLVQLSLPLNSNQSRKLNGLSKLKRLMQLTLPLDSSQVDNLDELSKLSNLKELTIYFVTSQVRNLEPLSKLGNLTQLTLNLSGSRGINLESLTTLSNLIELRLDLSTREVSNWEALSNLSNLKKLTLSFSTMQGVNLESLSKLNNLTQLAINLSAERGLRAGFEIRRDPTVTGKLLLR